MNHVSDNKSKDSSPSPRCQRFSHVFFLNCIVLHFTFKPMVYVYLILYKVYGLGSGSVFSLWISRYSSTICITGYPLSIGL